MYSLFEDGWGDINSDNEKAFLETIYPHCPNESIDYGILEKSSQVYVLKSDFGWSDLGSWGAIYSDQKKIIKEMLVFQKIYFCMILKII